MHDVDAIDLYWRPGCGFCRALEADLANVNLAIRRHNIWEDEAAAAFVRSVANGNEVVPTVAVTFAQADGSLCVSPPTLANPCFATVSVTMVWRTITPWPLIPNTFTFDRATIMRMVNY